MPGQLGAACSSVRAPRPDRAAHAERSSSSEPPPARRRPRHRPGRRGLRAGAGGARTAGSVAFEAARSAASSRTARGPRRRRAIRATACRAGPTAIDLGETLFFDARLSRERPRCRAPPATSPTARFTDGRPRATGLAEVDRNTPGARQRAPVSAGSAGTAPATACGRRASARCSTRARWAATAADVARAAARRRRPRAAATSRPSAPRRAPTTSRCSSTPARRWPRSRRRWSAARTPFDEFRDALARGDRAAAAHYPAAAQRGAADLRRPGQLLRLPLRARTSRNGEFHDIGVPVLRRPGPRRRRAPRRNPGGCSASRFNLLGPLQRRPVARRRPPAPATSRSSTATSASSRCRGCATSR